MLQVQHLHKAYGATSVLADISFIVNDGEHVGLIGPNGAGKSTLLRCIVGAEAPDAGTITRMPPDLSIGYLAQALDASGHTLGDVLDAAQAEFVAAERAVQQASAALANAPDLAAALATYDVELARFEALGGYAREHRAIAVAEGLGLAEMPRDTPVAALSGGQKTRLGLATLLLAEPRLLLLDEPTNHLDIDALAWLEAFVRDYPGAVIVVSHDREFLDRTITRVLYLDPFTRTIRSYEGSYSDFASARDHERTRQLAAWQDEQAYIRAVEADIRRVKGLARTIQQGPKRHRDHYGRISAKVARIAKSRERKLEKYLESDERIEKPRQHWRMKLDFGDPPPGGRAVLALEHVDFAYTTGDAPLLVSDVGLEVWHGERVALVGPNGAGKTTLLRLITGQLVPLRGRVRLGINVRPGMLAQEHETLDAGRTLLEMALRARPMSETDARTFLHMFLFGGDSVFRNVRECSLGERSRLQLALLVLQGCNLLLLDEPLNHLDIEAREHFEAALDAFEGTVIAVAHDRAFLRHFAERVVEVRDGTVRSFAGGYDDYMRIRAASAEMSKS
ncbi:MAG: ABC-F family ATP-binding cassette domain-containing protein [Chloroflexi bacterium]|nr:ABC-F family ATP-binding cassette domain-containing protein [Chloroflexota bacterium]